MAESTIPEFIKKRDFDFSKPSEWEEFLRERSQIGNENYDITGSNRNGNRLRDFKNYNCFTLAFASNKTIDITIEVRPVMAGNSTVTPPGIVYVYYPNESWQHVVSKFGVGGDSYMAPRVEKLRVGGPTPENKDGYWDIIRIIVRTTQPKLPPGTGKVTGTGSIPFFYNRFVEASNFGYDLTIIKDGIRFKHTQIEAPSMNGQLDLTDQKEEIGKLLKKNPFMILD